MGTSARANEELAQIDLHRAGRRSTKSQRAAKNNRVPERTLQAIASAHRRPSAASRGVTGETRTAARTSTYL